MTAVTKTGDWRRARALLAAGPLRLKAAIGLALRQEAEALRREIVQGLTRQAPGGSPLAPPKETTLAARRLKGFGGSKSLIVRADLRNGVATIVRGDEAFVGVPRTARGKDGQSLANVAEIQEFGSAPIVIPMTDAMRRFVFAVLREAGEPIGAGGGGGAGVVVVQVPARPFLRPAFERFKPGAQRRFLARVAAHSGMGGM